jgi:hypothetical protein
MNQPIEFESLFVERLNGSGEVTVYSDVQPNTTEYVRIDKVDELAEKLLRSAEIIDGVTEEKNILIGKLLRLLEGLGFTNEQAINWISRVDSASFFQMGGHYKFHSNAKMEVKDLVCNFSPRIILLN